MLKLKFENVLISIVLLAASFMAYRYFHRTSASSNVRQEKALAETSQTITVPKQRPSSVTGPQLPLNKQPQPLPAIPTQGSGSGPSKMAKYNEILNDPLAGLDRLHLLEQMQSEMSQDEIAMRAFYEVLNNGPAKELSADENHLRRNIVSVAFGMYLENCQNFDSCYQYVVAGMARYPDEEIFQDLYSQVKDKYTQDWQRDKIVAEMKKYGLVKTPKKK